MAQPLINITAKRAAYFAIFLVLYEFLTYIANDMIMPGMLQVTAAFHAPESSIASSLTAYLLGGASLQILLGPISDSCGRRPVMLFGACFFCICSLAIAASQSINQFLIARFFQGMGLCFIGVIGYCTLQEIFGEMDAIRLFAILATVAILAPLLGPLAGAIFLQYATWRTLFAIIGGLSLLTALGLWRFMPETVGQTKRDGSVITRIPFSPLIIKNNYLQLCKNKAFIFGAIAEGCLSLPCVAWIGLAPIILVTDAHLSMLQYGLWQLPIFGASIIGNIILHRITHKFNLKTIITIGSIITVIGTIVMLGTTLWLSNYISLIPGLIIYFFGISIANSPLNRYILFVTKISKGTASALLSMILMAILAGGLEIINYLYSTHSLLIFSIACAIIGLFYIITLYASFAHNKDNRAI